VDEAQDGGRIHSLHQGRLSTRDPIASIEMKPRHAPQCTGAFHRFVFAGNRGGALFSVLVWMREYENAKFTAKPPVNPLARGAPIRVPTSGLRAN